MTRIMLWLTNGFRMAYKWLTFLKVSDKINTMHNILLYSQISNKYNKNITFENVEK